MKQLFLLLFFAASIASAQYMWSPIVRPVESAFIFWDEFTDGLAPGAVNGTLSTSRHLRTVVDTETKMSITGGNLSFSGGKASPEFQDPKIIWPNQTRIKGKLLVADFNPPSTTTILYVGFYDSTYNGACGTLCFNTGSLTCLTNYGNTNNSSYSYTAQNYKVAVALRTAGEFYFMRTTTTDWKLLFGYKTGADTPLYPAVKTYNGPITSSFIRIPRTLWLPTPLASDGLTTASQKVTSTPVTGATLNGNLETWTTPTNAANWGESTSGTSTIRDTSASHSGSHAAKLTLDGSGSRAVILQLTSAPNDRYAVTMWARTTSGTATVIIGDGSTGSNSTAFTATTDWQQFSASVTVLEDLGPQVGTLTDEDNANDTVLVDDIVVQRVNLGQTDGLGHAEGIAGGLGSGGSGKTWTHGGTWSFNNIGKAINTPTLGAEAVVNGEFSTNTDGWAANNSSLTRVASATRPGTASGGSDAWAVMIIDSGSSASARQTVAGTIGRWYRTFALGYIPSTDTDANLELMLGIQAGEGEIVYSSSISENAWITLMGVGRSTVASMYSQVTTSNGAVGDSGYYDAVSIKPLLASTLYSTVETSTADVLVSTDVVVTAVTQAGLVISYADTNNLVLAYHDGTNAKLDKCVSTVLTSGATLNGNFETWTTRTNAADWVEVIEANSSLNDTSICYSGSHGIALLSWGGIAGFYRSHGVVGKMFRISYWAKSATGTAEIGGSGVASVVGTTWTYVTKDMRMTDDSPIIYIAQADTVFIDDVTITDLQTWTSVISAAATYSSGATLTVIKDGTSYHLFYNNTKIGSTSTISDAALISNTKHGLFSTYSGNTLDNFLIYARGTDGEYSILNTWSQP